MWHIWWTCLCNTSTVVLVCVTLKLEPSYVTLALAPVWVLNTYTCLRNIMSIALACGTLAPVPVFSCPSTPTHPCNTSHGQEIAQLVSQLVCTNKFSAHPVHAHQTVPIIRNKCHQVQDFKMYWNWRRLQESLFLLQFGSKRSLDQFILWTCVPKDMWIRVPKVSKLAAC